MNAIDCIKCKHAKKNKLDAPCYQCKNCNMFEKPEIKEVDNVNHPPHYTGAIETIDYMQDKLNKDAFEGYCAGNVIKYISRYKKKNGLEDLKKCQWYLNKLIETMKEVKK